MPEPPKGKDSHMKITLIVATYGRVEELDRLFTSLADQTYRQFETIVVDQNDDDRLVHLIKKYQRRFSILHIRSDKGLSKARNVGLELVTGSIVAFPDDDCWYPRDLLAHVEEQFRSCPHISGVTGMYSDEHGNTEGRWQRESGAVTRKNVWHTAISFTIFLRKEVTSTVGKFDETLGVGAGTPWGAGEETDYLLRALSAGASIVYLPTLHVKHPTKVSNRCSQEVLDRVRRYSAGAGRVVKKHRYSIFFKAMFVMKPCAKMLAAAVAFRVAKCRIGLADLRGRLTGLQ